MTLIDGSVPPVYGSVPPVYDSVLPVYDSVPPVYGSVPPVYDSVPPVYDSVLPVYDSVYGVFMRSVIADDYVGLCEWITRWKLVFLVFLYDTACVEVFLPNVTMLHGHQCWLWALKIIKTFPH